MLQDSNGDSTINGALTVEDSGDLLLVFKLIEHGSFNN